ncbi:MAG: T9SS type A sorting domain-containing protein [Bacteroidetes bacterium]|nr:T9SS type A sorting domain-containing protein [Bacteroidota bacterium]
MKSTLSRLLLASFIFPIVSLGQSPTRIAGDATGNYSVIAFMVDFQDETGTDRKDTDPLTYGTGKFVTTARDSGFLDSWPRNRTYFENHLTYLKNYWSRVSEGRLTISQTHVISSVITLPKKMKAYSAIGQTQPEGYASLISDFYAELDKNPLLVQEMQDHYAGEGKTHFIIFHAGLGRDIDWGSILGGDPTPADLPSLFVNGQSDVPFLGKVFPSGLVIDHLSILPETLSRTIESFGKEILLSFGINGVMIANFGNFLGLPDLYNTKTGASGVGSFGLMDGYGFFNFNGFIPSPPNVWEKYQLGWINPSVVDISQLPADWTIEPGEPLFIHLGERKYYLLEALARNPVPSEKGVTVTTADNGSLISTSFFTDKDEFYSYSQTGIKGVITDVSNPYWVIPAGINSNQDTINGGLLIWRLDDSQLSPGMTTRSFSQLNSTTETKILKVVEADGSFDIGQTYDLFSGGGGSETGTIFDYWYPGNIAPVYKNEFSTTSTPSSDWAYRIPSGLKLTNFARAGNGIKITLSTDLKSNTLIKSRDVLKLNAYAINKFAGNSFVQGGTLYSAVFISDSLLIFKEKVKIFETIVNGGINEPVFIHEGDSTHFVCYNGGNVFNLVSVSNGAATSRTLRIPPIPGQDSEWLINPGPVVTGNKIVFLLISRPSQKVFIAEFPSGKIAELVGTSGDNAFFPISNNIFNWKNKYFLLTPQSFGFSLSSEDKFVEVKNDFFTKTAFADTIAGQIFCILEGYKLVTYSIPSLLTETNHQAKITGELTDSKGFFISSPDGYIKFERNKTDSLYKELKGFTGETQISSFPLTFQDEIQNVRVVETGTELVALIKTNRSWFSKTLYSNDEPMALQFGLGDGNLVSGENWTVTTTLLPDGHSFERVVLNAKTVYPGFRIRNYGNLQTGNTNLSQKQYSQTFNPNNEVIYSWPNPSSDGLVKFRLNLPFTGDGKITLLDLSGQKIGSINVSFSKNQETEWVWDTGRAQSGLYFASVEISGEGKSVSKVLKVVLIK